MSRTEEIRWAVKDKEKRCLLGKLCFLYPREHEQKTRTFRTRKEAREAARMQFHPAEVVKVLVTVAEVV